MAGLWLIRVRADDPWAAGLEDALSLISQSVARFQDRPTLLDVPQSWRIEATLDHEPHADEVAAFLARWAEGSGGPEPDFEIVALEDADWLARNRSSFPPVAAGRFFVHGSHFNGEVPAGKIGIRLDAGPAFGSGTHGSTQGALMAIDRLAAERPVRRALDIGCGSGILAIALAAVSEAEITASDREQAAVGNVIFNAAENGVAERVTALHGEGVTAPVRGRGPFDFIVANILAEPLIAMARDLAGILEPGGTLILSGMIAPQEQDVLAAYREAGVGHRRTLVLGDWSTLILARLAPN